jgi:hypothetical protein
VVSNPREPIGWEGSMSVSVPGPEDICLSCQELGVYAKTVLLRRLVLGLRYLMRFMAEISGEPRDPLRGNLVDQMLRER